MDNAAHDVSGRVNRDGQPHDGAVTPASLCDLLPHCAGGVPSVALLDQLPFLFYVKDLKGRYVTANRRALEVFGVASVEALAGKTSQAFFTGRCLHEIDAREQDILAGKVSVADAEVEKPNAGDHGGWLLLVQSPLYDRDGRLSGIIAMGRDITGRKRAEFLRRGHAALLEQIARGYPLVTILEGLVHLVEAQLTDIRASILFYEEETGCLRHGAAPTLPAEYTRLIDGVKAGRNVGSCGSAAWLRLPVMVSDIATDPRWQGYEEMAAGFGLRSCWSTPIIDGSGTLFGTFALYSGTVREPSVLEMEITAMATDIAAIAIARARNEQKIHHLAHHDELTGLPNRRHFMQRFSDVIEEAGKARRNLVVAYFDLDGFKPINDTLGHGVGDWVLCELAARLKQNVRAGDLTVRLGGDEFAIVMACEEGEERQLLARLGEIRADLARPLRWEDRTLVCGASMGVALFPRDGATPDALLAKADAGMYAAKKLRRARRAA